MTSYLFSIGDLALQCTAAFLAVRLIKVTEKSTAWTIIALAIVFLAFHRGLTVWQWISTGVQPPVSHEIICLSTSALMVVGIALITPLFRNLKDSEEKLRNSEKTLSQSEQKLHFLASQLLIAQEKERQKLAHELLEDLGQTLQALKLQTGQIKQGLPKGSNGLCLECEAMLNQLQKIIERVRSLSWELSPYPLEDLGLQPVLQRLIEEFSQRYKIQSCQTEFDEIDHLFPASAHINIYRLFQEALSNIGEHARASRVAVTVKRHQDKVSFVFTDNGQGFDVSEVPCQAGETTGYGLVAMEERAKLLGGFLHIDSLPGLGTELQVTAPIPLPA